MSQVKIVTEEPPTKKVKVGEAAEVAVVSPSNGGSSNGKEKATNDEVVFGFFKKVSELLANEEDDEYRDYIKDMIDKYPDLVQVECPAGVDEDWEGMNMVQCLICYAGEFSPDLRDDMYDLVCGGAIATEMCYSMVWDLGSWGYLNMDTVVVLVLSGYMPLRFEESFMIDALFEQCQVQGDPDLIDEVVEILLRKVKAGDSLGCGPVPEKVVARFENLPTLEEGVTHEAGGDFAKYLKEYLEEKKEEKKASVSSSLVVEPSPDEEPAGSSNDKSSAKSRSTDRTCMACHETKSRDKFSKSQRSKPLGQRRCKACVEQNCGTTASGSDR